VRVAPPAHHVLSTNPRELDEPRITSGHGARFRIANCDTRSMVQVISVRRDDEAERALRALESAWMSRSEAIRSALIDSAQRLRHSSALAAEVAALEADLPAGGSFFSRCS